MIFQRFTYRLIRLFSTKLKYTHLSFYLDKRSYYHSVLSNQYIEVDKYVSLCKDTDNLAPVYSEVNILPDLLGRDIEFVKMVYGKPLFSLTEKNITIFIYKRKLSDIKVRYEIHSYMDRVFFVCHNYQTLIKQERDFVIRSILKKYLDSADVDGLTDKKIVDKSHNMLIVNELMGLKINYLCTKNSEWFSKMLAEIKDRIQALETRSQIKERRFLARI